jgi:hypothetical protein
MVTVVGAVGGRPSVVGYRRVMRCVICDGERSGGREIKCDL